MRNIEKLDNELGKSAFIQQWDNDQEVKEPDLKNFFDPEPVAAVKDKQPDVLPKYDVAGFNVSPGDKFDPGVSSKLDSDADKTFPYHEVDKDGGVTIIANANDDKEIVDNFRAISNYDRPQSLAISGGTPFGGLTNFQ